MALAAAGDPSTFVLKPNCMSLPPVDLPATGPPFGMYPEAPAALIVTDGLRLWSPSPEVELVGVLPLTIVGAPTAGTAGGITTLPFTGELVSGLPCCTSVEPPDATCGVELPDAEGGEKVFLVAVA